MASNDVSTQPLIFSSEILRLLTDLLYPDPRMAIREILANAADAITMALPVYPPGLQPQIVLTPNRLNSTLTVEDNGIGIPFDEVNVLNKVGADEDKRRRFEEILKKKTGKDGGNVKEQLIDLIGRYAIGRLACLCIASQVNLESRSMANPGSPGVQWTMRENNMVTEVRTIEKDRPGTRVILHIKEEYRDQILLSERLEEIVREYGAFLPYPIHIGAVTSAQINLANPVIYEGKPGVNLNPVPYRITSDRSAATSNTLDDRYQSLWDSLYGGLRYDPPLVIFPIITEHVRGMLFIPSDLVFLEMGRVRLWCRRMFVKGNEEDLLPAWARSLLSGVLDCQADPNLARTELLRSNEREYKALKEEIETQIVRQLGLLVSYGGQWERVVSVYRLPLVYGANVNGELMRRIGHRIPFRKAVRVKGDLPGANITLESYRVQMERRTGEEQELPMGTFLDLQNNEAVREHQHTLYYYTGEGSLSGIIERETVLHAASNQDVALLQGWCRLNEIRAMNVGHELPFVEVPGMQKFVETVRDAIGADADRRKLEIRAVKMDHRADIPSMLTSENARQRKAEQYIRDFNALSDEEIYEGAKQFEGSPVKLETLSRVELTELLVQARLYGEEHEESGHSVSGSQDVFYLNMSNELMNHLALESLFETVDEIAFRAQVLHEIWHSAKLSRGEPIVQPNADHHSQTAVQFIEKAVLDLYAPLRKARADLERSRQREIGKNTG